MTLEERAKVEELAALLYPADFANRGRTRNPLGQVSDWDARLWPLYDALIKTGLMQ